MHDSTARKDYRTVSLFTQKERENVFKSLGILDNNELLFISNKGSLNFACKRKSYPFIAEKQSPLCRRSLRAKSKGSNASESEESELESDCASRKKYKLHSNKYGNVAGVTVGDWWKSRLECSRAGVHKPTIAGIHSGKDGAYSVAISEDYEDDQDNGYCFTYTGCGGKDLTSNKRNLRWVPQCKDQTADGANSSLIQSIETRYPVRVIRSYKLKSQFAPTEGYRYDGLYTVEKYWTCIGKSGFLVYKFLMKRCENQPSAPWDKENIIPREKIKILKLRKKSSTENTDMRRASVGRRSNTNVTRSSATTSNKIIKSHVCRPTTKNNTTNTLKKPCIIKYRRSAPDDSNKENSVIIKRHSLGSRRNRSNSENCNHSFLNNSLSSIRRRLRGRPSNSNKNSANGTASPASSISVFNISSERRLKWSLFASEAEIKRFHRYLKAKRRTSLLNREGADLDEYFRGFENNEGSVNKVIILGFMINDLANEEDE